MIPQPEVKNRLHKMIPSTGFLMLSRKMERVDLAWKDVLVEADLPASHVCFIESGLACIVAESSDDQLSQMRRRR